MSRDRSPSGPSLREREHEDEVEEQLDQGDARLPAGSLAWRSVFTTPTIVSPAVVRGEVRYKVPMEQDPDPGDGALDAYSQVVTTVADRLIPSVASLRVRQQARGRSADGAGSGVVITPDRFALTSAHVVDGTDQGSVVRGWP